MENFGGIPTSFRTLRNYKLTGFLLHFLNLKTEKHGEAQKPANIYHSQQVKSCKIIQSVCPSMLLMS